MMDRSMKKCICIHGHFYQPPRENAWLEEIELQDSAYPFHDWNERINYECYEPNSASRILGPDGRITEIVNNYSRISFNFGPTLLRWLDRHSPELVKALQDADRQSRMYNNGHGNALAQGYHHLIMPLANRRDKRTQVRWARYDFRKHFGREPEGLWLPETAVDTETLEVLAEEGIAFTILAPRQARRIRKRGSENWEDVSGEKIDTRRAYLCRLPSGRSITLFFYDGAIARDVAFNGLLDDGKRFAGRLLDAFEAEGETQLVHIATDGESYGHHHKQGEMALSYCIRELEESGEVSICNYARFLEINPPVYEVEIFENSSWSCVHGVERWRSNCGCNTGMHAGWQQEWRKPLRESLDWLRDELIVLYEELMKEYCSDPWEMRDRYIEIIENREEENVKRFLSEFIDAKKAEKERTRIIRLLEMQRHAMLMFTSCAWFFDEISGIETLQILQYANRAIQLAASIGGPDLDEEFGKRLEAAPSNSAAFANGGEVYDRLVRPKRLTLSKVGMHYAVASLFNSDPEHLRVFNYKSESRVFDRLEAGRMRLSVGRTVVHSLITFSRKEYTFAALYLGQQHIIGSVSSRMDDAQFRKMFDTLRQTFLNDSLASLLTQMEEFFGSRKFSLRSLFKDEQRKVLDQILQTDLELAEDSYQKIFDRNYNLLTVLKNEKIPLPALMEKNIELVINTRLRKYLENNVRSLVPLQSLLREVSKWKMPLQDEELRFDASRHLQFFMQVLKASPTDEELLRNLIAKLDHFEEMGLTLDLYKVQNIYFKAAGKLLDQLARQEENEERKKLLPLFGTLGDRININFEAMCSLRQMQST